MILIVIVVIIVVVIITMILIIIIVAARPALSRARLPASLFEENRNKIKKETNKRKQYKVLNNV